VSTTTMAPTQPSTPRLSEVARKLVFPEGIVESGWVDVLPRLSDMGVEYDPWQTGAVQLILGRDADGRYTATVGGVTISIPRQVGKTFTVGSLLVAMCLAYPGLRVVWTSHHLRTTTNTFRSMQSMVRRPRVFRHLARNGIRTANGEQEIKFANGSIIMFGAREHGFGVGIDAIDVLVCDEAQRLSSRTLADIVPTTNQARHPHGALLFFIGTPPRPDNAGDEFAARRLKAYEGRLTNGVFIEFSADHDGDFDDPEQWRKANPSYPHRTPHESMLRMRENLNDPDDWRREAMGVWDEAGSDRPISLEAWHALAVPRSEVPSGAPDCYSLTMSPSRVACIAVGVKGAEADYVDLAELDVVEDADKLVAWLVKRCGQRTPVLIDSRDPAASFISVLKTAKVKVKTTNASDSGRACGGLVDAIDEKRVSHCGQPAIRAALAVAEKRDVGKAGLWEWQLEDQLPETAALRALTLAHYGLSFERTKSAPRRIR
jgi:hypothetical protein